MLKPSVVFDANKVDIPFAHRIVQAAFQSWCAQTSAPGVQMALQGTGPQPPSAP